MTLSIIIPAKNEEQHISGILKSIFLNKAFDPKEIEVIVVINTDSVDKTYKLANKYKVKLLQKGIERSVARNFGAKMAKGRYLLFLDADMQVSKHLLQEVLDTIKFSCKKDFSLIIPERIPGNSIYCKARDLEKRIYVGIDKVSAARLFNRKTFLNVDGFNEEMHFGEDWELDRKIRAKNIPFSTTKAYLKHHEKNLGLIGSIRKKIYYATVIKNYRVAIQAEVNPIYRFSLLLCKPELIIKHPIPFCYLLLLKGCEFGIGFLAYIKSRFN